MPKSDVERQRDCRERKKKIARGLIPITLWCYPVVIRMLRGWVKLKLKVVKSKDTRDNLEDILRELQKYDD